jgi:mycofactocin glycosyltransferase
VSRPAVSVVMPFAGGLANARAALDQLAAIEVADGDELILVDNVGLGLVSAVVRVVRAVGERSPAHARNAGAAAADRQWILFLDADCTAPPDLLDRYFLQRVVTEVGALVGEVVAAGDARTLAERYGAARNFLSQRAHMAHPYLPRAAAANLLVRRAAFEAVGGFHEGLRAAEDTDLSWRLQQAGWHMELRPEAHVEHRYRATVGELRRQWRGYAAGRRWLAARYEGFTPEPALLRATLRVLRRATGRPVRRRVVASVVPASLARVATALPPARSPRGLDHLRFLLLDAVLAVDELVGFFQSNRPSQ